jgi:enoyl-CoA hydratase/carnithine racemase
MTADGVDGAETVLRSVVEPGIAVLIINRPASRNAVDLPTAELIGAAIADLDDDPRFAVGVLTGAGGCFSAGMDLKAFAATGQRPSLPGRGLAGFTERPPPSRLSRRSKGGPLAAGWRWPWRVTSSSPARPPASGCLR